MKKKRNLKERICALLLAVLMPLVSVMPNLGMVVMAEEPAASADPAETVEAVFTVTDSSENGAGLSGVTITVNGPEGNLSAPEKDGSAGTYTVTLTKGQEYTYLMEKDGYVPEEGSFTAEDGTNVEAAMELAEIVTDPAELNMKVGDTATISIANVVGDKKNEYVWESSNPAAVSVSAGKVTAKGEGSAYVTVTYKGKTATVPVNVVKHDTFITLLATLNSENNMVSVTCEVKDLPGDATGGLTFKIDGENERDIDTAYGTSVTYDITDMPGNHTFEVAYSGDEKYNSSSAVSGTLNYKKDVPLEYAPGYKEGIKEIIYAGTDGWNTPFTFAVDPTNKRVMKYEIVETSEPDVVKISDEGDSITPVNKGKVTIRARAAEDIDEKYKAAELEFTLIISPKEITSLDEIEWTDVSRVYDGTTTVTFQGIVRNTAEPSEDHRAELTVEMTDKNVGENKEYSPKGAKLQIFDQNCTAADNYSKDNFNKKIEITPRPLYLSCADTELSYGTSIDKMKSVIEARDNLTGLYNGNGVNGDNTGLIAGDEVDLPKATLNSSTLPYVGSHKIICPKMGATDADNIKGNYVLQFSVQGEAYGTLNVTQQQLTNEKILGCIELVSDSNAIKKDVDENGNLKIWIKGGINGVKELAFKIKEGSIADGYYDEIYIKPVGDEGGTELTAGKLVLPEISESGQIETEIYLSNSNGELDELGNSTTRTTASGTQLNESNKIKFITADCDAPSVAFNGQNNDNVVSSLGGNILFDNFDNKVVIQEVTVKDNVDGSGIDTSEYFVWKIGERNDNTAGDSSNDITPDRVREKINQIESENAWQKLDINAEGKAAIPVGAGTKEELENNYIVLVKTKDQVQNSEVYASNGIVIEQHTPTVHFEVITQSINKFHNTDIYYKLSVEDNAGIMSGIKELDVNVKTDNEVVQGGKTSDETYGEVYADSYTITDDKGTDGRSLDELSEDSVWSIVGKITAEKNNSNNVALTVNAIDRAGNNAKTFSGEFKIDITAPQMNVSYDNNDPVNEKYFQNSREMTVTYTERNFDIEKATFDMVINGEIHPGLTIDKINALGQTPSVEIKAEWKEVDEQVTDEEEIKKLKDTETNHIVITFGKPDASEENPSKVEGCDYVDVIPHCMDKATNENKADENIYAEGTKAEKTFSIDNADPNVKVTYDIGSRKALTDINGVKTNEEITATVVITEKNFIENQSFSANPEQIQFQLEGTEIEEKDGKEKTIFDLDQYAEIPGSWVKEENTNNYVMSFKINVDANYKFKLTYTDLSGRSVSYDERSFTYDKTSPTGTITMERDSWKKEWRSFLSMITFGIFEPNALDVKIESDDHTAGVKSTAYYKYVPGAEERNEFPGVEAKDLEKCAWVDIKSGEKITLKPDEQAVIYERIEDAAGNITYINSDGVIIDGSKPDDPVIKIETKDVPQYDIYNASVPFTITVEDPEVGGTYSGLQSVSYEVRKDGVVTQSGNYDAQLKPKAKRQKNLQEKEVVDAKLNNSNDVVIYVKAVDNAGNQSYSSLPLKIDTTKPTIQVQYDKNDPANTKYFQNSRKMTVTYTERNFDINLATFDMTINGEKFEGYTIDQINKLAGQYGVRAKWTEAGKKIGDETKLKDDRQNHVVLTFTGNKGTGGCDYVNITPHCTDRAVLTNEGVDYGDSKASRTFSIDNLDPVAIVKYYVNSKDVTSQAEAGELFANQEITAEIRVVEKNFIEGTHFSADPEQIKFNLTGTEAPDGIIDADAQAEAYTNWDADSQTLKIRFNKDANYTFSFTYTDLSGRQVNYEPRNFTYDQTAPTGTISILGSVWDSFLQTITFGFFERDSVVADITSDDVTAGVAFTGYYKYAPGEEERHQFDGLSWEELDTLGDDAWTPGYQAVISPNEQSVVYVKVVDRSGNVTYINNHDGVVEDNVSPEAPNITITMADPAYGIYNSNVPFHISVTEPTVNSSYAGLQSVYYEVRRDGAVTQSGNYDDALAPKSSRVKNLERDEVVNAELNNSNNVLIYVRATDNSGNVAEAEKELKIDITKPTIQVEYDNNAPLNDRYYNATRTATVTVTERNFDTNAVRFEITNTDGVQPSISGWSSSADAGVSDNATNTCYVTFADDGDYTLTLNCTDLAGNDSEYSQVDEFTIDKTVPTISVSYDNNSAATPGYYSAPRTATVTINEHNFNGSEVRAAITGALQGQGVQTPGVSGWSQSGDTHTATISYTADADYTFDIDYSDLAGNAAADYTQESFTIDQTKPEINIFDIVDKSANNGVVAPGVQYSDVNYTPDGVTISLQGANHGVINLNGDRTNVANGESIKMADFEHTQEMDDLYTLTAKVQDKAGNVDEKSVMFSVNRFGSVYVFSDDTKKLLDQYYTNEEQDLHVTEINVDTLEFNGISYGRDGELVNLKSGTDYTVKASGSETSWKQYQYTIKKQNFEKEGNYTVTIDSRDRATNQVNNKVKNKNIEFVIDKTKPTVVITGIENKAQYRADSRDISIAVSDNIAMDNMDIYVGGDESPSKSYTANMIMKAKGEIPFTLGSASSFQEVKAVAVDAAGNVAETSPMSVLVTSNVLVQFYSNKPVMFGSIGGIAVIAVAVYMILSKKKKNPSEKA